MRITGRALRQIIRETLTAEGPLFFGPDDSSTDYSTPPLDYYDRGAGAKKSGSIGRRALRKAQGRAEAKLLFQNTPDNWAIVTLDNIYWSKDVIRGAAFKAWIAKRGFPPGTRILVIADPPIKGDFTSTQWTVAHDIIGHTLHTWIFRKYFKDPFSDAKTARHLVFTALFNQLPKEKQVGTGEDYIPDALAGLFFGEVDLTSAAATALQAAQNSRFSETLVPAVEDVVKALEEGIPAWIASIPPDVPTLINPF